MRIKKSGMALLLLALIAVAQAAAAAEAYNFPYAGLSLEVQSGWTVLTPQTLDAQGSQLAMLGVDIDTLRTEYAVQRTICEVFFADGVTVSISSLNTEKTLEWGAIASMTRPQKDDFLAAFSGEPYQNTAWITGSEFVRSDWSMTCGEEPMYYAALFTVREGRLYQIIARGREDAVDTLHEAGQIVLRNLTFTDIQEEQPVEEKAPELGVIPEPIMDDGVATPLALVDFTGISKADSAPIAIQTLPNTELLLKTANDSLRGKADENGMLTFTLSTRRETVYEYTLVGTSQGRKASSMNISIERRLSDEELLAAYQKEAKPLSNLYAALLESADEHTGAFVTFRGTAVDFKDENGTPWALFYSLNGKNGWTNPVWVVFPAAVPLAVSHETNLYGEIRGDTQPAANAEGAQEEAPVITFHSMVD